METVYGTVKDSKKDLTGSADDGFCQMSAHRFCFLVGAAHVQMGVVFMVHGIDVSRQGDDLMRSREMMGMIAFVIAMVGVQATVEAVIGCLLAGTLGVMLSKVLHRR